MLQERRLNGVVILFPRSYQALTMVRTLPALSLLCAISQVCHVTAGTHPSTIAVFKNSIIYIDWETSSTEDGPLARCIAGRGDIHSEDAFRHCAPSSTQDIRDWGACADALQERTSFVDDVHFCVTHWSASSSPNSPSNTKVWIHWLEDLSRAELPQLDPASVSDRATYFPDADIREYSITELGVTTGDFSGVVIADLIVHHSDGDLEKQWTLQIVWGRELKIPWWDTRFEPKAHPFPLNLLLPIWLTSNRMDYDYNPPSKYHSALNARPLSKFRLSLPLLYASALAAYGTLLSLTSISHLYIVEAIQMVAFFFFPLLPAVQFIDNATAFIFRESGVDKWQHVLFALTGTYVFEEYEVLELFKKRKRIVDVPKDDLVWTRKNRQGFKWLGTWALILANAIPLSLTVAAYFRRVSYTFRSAQYVAAIGLDHRCGWVAFGGLIAVCLTALFQLCNTRVNLMPGLNKPPLNIINEGTVFTEIIAAAFVQDLLVIITSRNGVATTLTRLIQLKLLPVVASLVLVAAVRYRRQIATTASRHKLKLQWILLGVALLYCASVVALQALADAAEVLELEAGILYPWNYMWQVPDAWWTP